MELASAAIVLQAARLGAHGDGAGAALEQGAQLGWVSCVWSMADTKKAPGPLSGRLLATFATKLLVGGAGFEPATPTV